MPTEMTDAELSRWSRSEKVPRLQDAVRALQDERRRALASVEDLTGGGLALPAAMDQMRHLVMEARRERDAALAAEDLPAT